jgi:hypothetical protein
MFGFYADVALTVAYSMANPIRASFKINGTEVNTLVVRLGDPDPDLKIVDRTQPGISQLQVLVERIPGATGPHQTTDVKLALTPAGLSSAVAGDPLNVGTQILSGSANAIVIYMQVDEAANVTATDLRLRCPNGLREAV